MLYVTPHRWTPYFRLAADRRVIQLDRRRWDYKHQVLATRHMPPWRVLLWFKFTEMVVQGRPKALYRTYLHPDRGLRHAMRWYSQMGRRVWPYEICELSAGPPGASSGPTVRAVLGRAAGCRGGVDGGGSAGAVGRRRPSNCLQRTAECSCRRAGGAIEELTMSSFSIALTRALVGLAQGIALYLLYRASETGGWPATEPLAFAGLLVPAVFVPVMVVAGMGNLRPRTLAVWALLAAAVCAGLGVYDIFRDPLALYGARAGQPRIAPSPALWVSLGLVLFIGHALIVAAEAERKFVASYARHFDVAWKHGVQLALAVCVCRGVLGPAVPERGALPPYRHTLPDRAHRAPLVLRTGNDRHARLCHPRDRRARRSRARRAHARAHPPGVAAADDDGVRDCLPAGAAVHRASAALEHAACDRHSAGCGRRAHLPDQCGVSGRPEPGIHRPGGALRARRCRTGPRAAGCARRLRSDAAGAAVRLDATAHHCGRLRRRGELLCGGLCAGRLAGRTRAEVAGAHQRGRRLRHRGGRALHCSRPSPTRPGSPSPIRSGVWRRAGGARAVRLQVPAVLVRPIRQGGAGEAGGSDRRSACRRDLGTSQGSQEHAEPVADRRVPARPAQSRGANIAVVHPRGEALPDSFLRFDWTKEAVGIGAAALPHRHRCKMRGGPGSTSTETGAWRSCSLPCQELGQSVRLELSRPDQTKAGHGSDRLPTSTAPAFARRCGRSSEGWSSRGSRKSTPNGIRLRVSRSRVRAD